MLRAYLRYSVYFFIITIVAGCSKKDVYTFNSSNHHHKSTTKTEILNEEVSIVEKTNKNIEVVEANINNEIQVIEKKSHSVESLESEELIAFVEANTHKELNKIQKSIIKKAHKKAQKNKVGDNQIVALILCWFLGGLGIHRFYLGYTAEGILQLLTVGGCGIWWLIDLIRIITGDLGPKNGSYTETF